MFDVPCLIFDVRYPMSNVQHLMSDVQHVRRPMSDVPCLTSNVHCPMSHVLNLNVFYDRYHSKILIGVIASTYSCLLWIAIKIYVN